MKYKKLSTSDGKVIHIYDDVFCQFDREYHQSYCYESKFVICNQSNIVNYFKCTLSENELKDFCFFDNENVILIIKEHLGENVIINESWILPTFSGLSPHKFHHDSCTRDKNINEQIILYHVNLTWDHNWHGETLFLNDSNECEIAVEYKPGRIIVYDAKMYHSSSPITGSNYPRFIFAISAKSQSCVGK